MNSTVTGLPPDTLLTFLLVVSDLVTIGSVRHWWTDASSDAVRRGKSPPAIEIAANLEPFGNTW